MKVNVKVLFVSRYDFVSEDTGEVLKGCKVTFCVDDFSETDDSFGLKTYTGSLDYEEFKNIQKKSKEMPFNAVAIYEQVALDKKPKFKGLEY